MGIVFFSMNVKDLNYYFSSFFGLLFVFSALIHDIVTANLFEN